MLRRRTPKKTGESLMGLTYVTARLRVHGGTNEYSANFGVDSGATDTFAPAAELRKIGVEPVGKNAYELADDSLQEYEFGLVDIAFMGEITAGRVIFGPIMPNLYLELPHWNRSVSSSILPIKR
jgi:hypothetical protein